jgi:uncharacterized 2Fe-2S/4Fe-4S cluster protein (DUF4445 family)
MGRLIIRKDGKSLPLRKGETILLHLQELGIDIAAFCGGRGECRGCLIKVDDPGWLSTLTDLERRIITRPEYRLACRAKIIRDDIDLYIEVPKYPKYQILDRGKKIDVPLNPLVTKRRVSSKELIYSKEKELDEYEGEIFGLALDIGTTTIRMYWVDLENGNIVFTASMLNPQIRYGDNVIDRIHYAKIVDQKYLEITVRDVVNELIEHSPINHNHIYEMAIVGNSVMRDIFIGHSVESLGKSPFEPLSSSSIYLRSSDLGININKNAEIYALPLISHFVGADALAVILGTEMYKHSKITLAMDIGTNTEIIVGNADKIIVTSCASGPAFEGSGLKCGTGAMEGAIQKVEIKKNLKVMYETIRDKPPIGICGSGLIDALAQMLDRGILDWSGRFADNRREFVLAENGHHIYLDGEDIDNLKLAKSAISVGLKAVMRSYDVTIDEIDKLYLAGAFGTYINLENALKIGLLPDIQLNRIEKVGDIALEGARQVLISQEKRKDVELIGRIIQHVRLEMEEDFQDMFLEDLGFDKYSN